MMKSDADTIRSFLLGLLEYFSRTVSSPSGKVDDLSETPSQAEPLSAQSETSSSHQQANPMPLMNESSSSTFSSNLSIEMPPLSDLGEMPVVQDHFQTLLKRRLQIEIEQNPPLFPWESGLQEYPLEISETANHPWFAQLRSLELPTDLPENILTGLLNRCQSLVKQSMRPGIQLVKAVEDFFPDQPQAMNQIAGLVLASGTVRSTATSKDVQDWQVAFPNGYEGANPQQQVTLAMLAAKEILDALVINLTSDGTEVQREWLTSEGKVRLTARYQAGPSSQILLEVETPQPCQIVLPSTDQTVTQKSQGCSELVLHSAELGAVYPLEVYFTDRDAMPLTFAISWN